VEEQKLEHLGGVDRGRTETRTPGQGRS